MNMKQLFFNICIFLIALTLVGALFLGFYNKEIMGYFFVGILIASMLSDLLVLISIFCSKKEFYVSRCVWVLLSFMILILSFSLVSPFDVKASSEIGMIIGYPMSVLAMPLGIIASVISGSFDIRPESFYWGNFYDWFLFFIFGYIQWFVILPFIVRGQVPR